MKSKLLILLCAALMAAITSAVAPSVASAQERPVCERSDSDPDGDGWGWENGRSCKVAPGQPTQPTNPPAPAPNPAPAGKSSTTSPIKGISGPDCVGPNDNHNPPNMRFGDFILMNNAWNAGASNGQWSQCTSLKTNANGSVSARWSYDWLNEWQVNGPVWSVKSYPEVIYGAKSRGEISGDKATTGLPAKYRDLEDFQIDFAYSSTETTKRSKTVNGKTVYGEKNVAIESFFHSSCDIRRGAGGSNRTFEIMVWLDHGPERKPDGQAGYKGDVTIDGLRWEVWTKGAKDPGYIAFYAKNPIRSGSIDWNDFIDWARNNGAANGTRQFNDDWCMGNILFGTEIWWGEGTFSLDYLRISR